MNFNFSQTHIHTCAGVCVCVCTHMYRSPMSLTCINSIPTVSMHSHSLPCFFLPPILFFPLSSPISYLATLIPPPRSSLSSHFLHHDPLLCLFKPVLLSLPLLVSPSTQSLILCFLILPRETPDIQFIHSSLVSEPHDSFFFPHLVHFLSRVQKQGKNKRKKKNRRRQ